MRTETLPGILSYPRDSVRNRRDVVSGGRAQKSSWLHYVIITGGTGDFRDCFRPRTRESPFGIWVQTTRGSLSLLRRSRELLKCFDHANERLVQVCYFKRLFYKGCKVVKRFTDTR